MKSDKQADFTILTEKNVEHIAEELTVGNGIIVIADPEFCSSPPDHMTGEFEIHLYGKPTIDDKLEWINSPRGTKLVGGENHQTGWENDREYRLREKPQPRKPRQDAELHKQLSRAYGQPDNLDEMYDTARDFFERLPVGKYEFSIHMEGSSGHHLGRNKYTHWQAYYIPRSVSPRAGLTHALTWMLNQWNTHTPPKGWPKPFQFTEQHIKAMVDYALEDLKTGKVLAHNVQAGRDADVYVGLA